MTEATKTATKRPRRMAREPQPALASAPSMAENPSGKAEAARATAPDKRQSKSALVLNDLPADAGRIMRRG
jgi:hypothetical protein